MLEGRAEVLGKRRDTLGASIELGLDREREAPLEREAGVVLIETRRIGVDATAQEEAAFVARLDWLYRTAHAIRASRG